jgi:hypothetical protein
MNNLRFILNRIETDLKNQRDYCKSWHNALISRLLDRGVFEYASAANFVAEIAFHRGAIHAFDTIRKDLVDLQKQGRKRKTLQLSPKPKK